MSSHEGSINPLIPDDYVHTLPEEFRREHLSVLMALSTITVMSAAMLGDELPDENIEAHYYFMGFLRSDEETLWQATEKQLCLLSGNCGRGFDIAKSVGETPPRDILLLMSEAGEILADLQNSKQRELEAEVCTSPADDDDVPPWNEPIPDITDPLTEGEVEAVDFDKEWEQFNGDN